MVMVRLYALRTLRNHNIPLSFTLGYRLDIETTIMYMCMQAHCQWQNAPPETFSPEYFASSLQLDLESFSFRTFFF